MIASRVASPPHPSNRPLSADFPGFVVFGIKCGDGGKINGVSINITSLALVRTGGGRGYRKSLVSNNSMWSDPVYLKCLAKI